MTTPMLKKTLIVAVVTAALSGAYSIAVKGGVWNVYAAPGSVAARITSYNVCYTKLLRPDRTHAKTDEWRCEEASSYHVHWCSRSGCFSYRERQRFHQRESRTQRPDCAPGVSRRKALDRNNFV